jgi:hypothetical protein
VLQISSAVTSYKGKERGVDVRQKRYNIVAGHEAYQVNLDWYSAYEITIYGDWRVRKATKRNRLLAIVHIEKCAGTSMIHLLRQQLHVAARRCQAVGSQ